MAIVVRHLVFWAGLVALPMLALPVVGCQSKTDRTETSAAAEPLAVEDVDFSGKRITILVPNREGGPLDTYVRVIGPALVAELPGNPTLVVRNIPGSGNMAGANFFDSQAEPDGLTLLGVSSATYLNYAMGHRAAQYALKKYVPVVVSPQGVIVYALPEVVGDNDNAIQGARDYGRMIFGGHSPTSSELRHLLAFHLLGLNVRGVWGLASGPRRLAFMRGEVHVSLDSASTYLEAVKPMIANGSAVPLFSYGIRQEEEFARDPIAPDLPTFWELYAERTGHPLSGIERRAFDSLYATILANKGLVLPEGTPDAIRDVYRNAIDRVLAQPELVEKISADVGPYPFYLRDDADAAHLAASTMDQEVRSWLEKFLAENHPTNF